jgi:quercetin 2,3-dioxygenase
MKTTIYRASSRGKADYGWLKANYYFSFSQYYDPQRIHFGALRVLNDDHVDGGMGFGMHPHDNMEIITIPLEGELEHKDSMGNTGVIRPGEVQVMSAGTGVQHSEYNKNADQPVKLFQIWIFPDKKNVPPRYDQKAFAVTDRINKWQTLVSPVGNADGLNIHQQAWISMTKLEKGKTLVYEKHTASNGVFILSVDGILHVNGETLERRDAIGLDANTAVEINAGADTEVLLLEVPA